jgi:hypothetical protein
MTAWSPYPLYPITAFTLASIRQSTSVCNVDSGFKQHQMLTIKIFPPLHRPTATDYESIAGGDCPALLITSAFGCICHGTRWTGRLPLPPL